MPEIEKNSTFGSDNVRQEGLYKEKCRRVQVFYEGKTRDKNKPTGCSVSKQIRIIFYLPTPGCELELASIRKE